MDKAVDEVGRIHRGGNERYHRHAVEHYADGAWDEPPGTLVVEVEHIDVEREHLSHQDHDVLTQPAVGEHEAAPGQAERPVAGGRYHALEALGHYPLHQLSHAVTQLRQQTHY